MRNRKNISPSIRGKYYARQGRLAEVRKLQLVRDLNPQPLDWYYSALPTEPSSISAISGGLVSTSDYTSEGGLLSVWCSPTSSDLGPHNAIAMLRVKKWRVKLPKDNR